MMGAWGMAIFSNDTSADVRDDFREYISVGLSSEEATRNLLSEWNESLQDDDDFHDFWLGLAATQWKTGRLLDSVKLKALEIIESGQDLHRWVDGTPGDIRKRRSYLGKLREQLLSPQPSPTRIPKHKKSTSSFEQGDLALYELSDTTRVRFCVLNIWGDKGGTYSLICLLGLGNEVMDRKKLLLEETMFPHFTMIGHEPQSRIQLLSKGLELPPRNIETFKAWREVSIRGHVCTWRKFPEALNNVLPKLGWV